MDSFFLPSWQKTSQHRGWDLLEEKGRPGTHMSLICFLFFLSASPELYMLSCLRLLWALSPGTIDTPKQILPSLRSCFFLIVIFYHANRKFTSPLSVGKSVSQGPVQLIILFWSGLFTLGYAVFESSLCFYICSEKNLIWDFCEEGHTLSFYTNEIITTFNCWEVKLSLWNGIT